MAAYRDSDETPALHPIDVHRQLRGIVCENHPELHTELHTYQASLLLKCASLYSDATKKRSILMVDRLAAVD